MVSHLDQQDAVERSIVITAEDDENIRHLIRLQLEHAGYEVIEATNGQEAIDLTNSASPDTVLLDVDLPIYNGYEVLEKLKDTALTRNIPVVLITAQDSVNDVVTGLELGAHDHLSKPFALPELVARTRAAIRVKKLQDQLLEEREQFAIAAHTDALTGLNNRRIATTHLTKLIASSRRHSTPLSVALIDVDNFKQVNDTFGHSVGDEVLIRVANVIQSQLRLDDFAARWGGEEFLVILPMTNESGARELAERIRAAFVATPFSDDSNKPVQITVSIGVSTATDFDQLLLSADQALYKAKQSGRNRVRNAGDD